MNDLTVTNVKAEGMEDSIIVCDGDVDIPSLFGCVVLARGAVRLRVSDSSAVLAGRGVTASFLVFD